MDHPELKKGEVLYTYTTEDAYLKLLLETKRLGSTANHGKLPVFISIPEFKKICHAMSHRTNLNKKL